MNYSKLMLLFIKLKNLKNRVWGLGIGDWAQSPIPNPQSPIPNPPISFITLLFACLILINNIYIIYIKKFIYKQ